MTKWQSGNIQYWATTVATPQGRGPEIRQRSQQARSVAEIHYKMALLQWQAAAMMAVAPNTPLWQTGGDLPGLEKCTTAMHRRLIGTVRPRCVPQPGPNERRLNRSPKYRISIRLRNFISSPWLVCFGPVRSGQVGVRSGSRKEQPGQASLQAGIWQEGIMPMADPERLYGIPRILASLAGSSRRTLGLVLQLQVPSPRASELRAILDRKPGLHSIAEHQRAISACSLRLSTRAARRVFGDGPVRQAQFCLACLPAEDYGRSASCSSSVEIGTKERRDGDTRDGRGHGIWQHQIDGLANGTFPCCGRGSGGKKQNAACVSRYRLRNRTSSLDG